MAPAPDDDRPEDTPDDEPTQADLLAAAGDAPPLGHPADAVPAGGSDGEQLSTGTDTVRHTETGTVGDDADR